MKLEDTTAMTKVARRESSAAAQLRPSHRGLGRT